MKAHIESYGCALNRGEALEFESVLRSNGWKIVDDQREADLNFIATCVVIETTEAEMKKRIRELYQTGKPLVVSGCMVTTLRNKIEEIAPGATLVPPAQISELCDAVGLSKSETWIPQPWPGTAVHTIPIATGCLGDCAYCITRSARGRIESRRPEEILGEISRIDFSTGAKEIQITSQDSAAYGSDIGTNLPALLNRLVETGFDMRIRVGMMNPRTLLPILNETVDAFSSGKIFKFLHLPVQSGSDRLLGEMGRGHSVADFKSIIDAFRDKHEQITLSTDIIVGYPDESDEDHERNVQLVKDIKPDILNITRFSARPGTRAALSKERVPSWKAKDRSRELTALRFEISMAKNRAKVGRKMKALVTETGSKGSMIARGPNYEQVILEGNAVLGRVYEVEIIDCSPIHLIGAVR
ncbi:MAG: tRNA (N(6)-L-threonylcarbamoyladenosine(37)-C(2))-methylthiotransferase [Thermoplasmata archaeon]